MIPLDSPVSHRLTKRTGTLIGRETIAGTEVLLIAWDPYTRESGKKVEAYQCYVGAASEQFLTTTVEVE